MKKLITDFTKQLKHAVEIAEHVHLSATTNRISNVLISGMGGSGIGGNMATEIANTEAEMPIIVNKDYFLPNFVSKNSLVIISSYSGDTEETVKALEEAITRNAHIVCITSGGKIKQLAKEHNLDIILVPTGMPPRAALGFSLVQLLHILNFYGVISAKYKTSLTRAIELLDTEESNIVRDAKQTALELENKNIIIYGTAGMESVALRFRQQVNENSKRLCWHNVFPELNHNELQGWKEKNNKLAVVIFRNETDYLRNAKRIDISKEIISHYDATIKEVYSKGSSQLEHMLYLIHWGDWLSYFLAERKGIDTMDIKVINYLKSELAKVEEY